MKNKSHLLFFGLCPLIPAAAHFSDGCIFAVEFWLLFFTAVLCRKYIKRTKYAAFSLAAEYAGMLTVAVFYHSLLRIIFPLAAFQLELYLYVSVIAYLPAQTIINYHAARGKPYIAVFYSLLLPLTGLVRELFAFGTVSFPVPSGFFSIQLIPPPLPLRFFGTNAGTFILLGLGLWFFRCFQNSILSAD